MCGKPYRVLGISGSPRKAATDFVVQEALRYLEAKGSVETRYFSVMGKKLNFCTHCDHCIRKKQGCIFKDAMEEVYQLLAWADAFVFASPVYQGNISGQLKTLFDRTRALLAQNSEAFEGKIGTGIAVGGDRVGGQEPTLRTIHDFYIINHILSTGGGAFGANLGATIWSKDKRAKGAKADKRGLKTLYKTMDRLFILLEKLR
ncbi:MAG: flavodoxin family protein [Promethearchaeota archaeon]